MNPKRPALSRREREIMEILYRRGRATAGEVMNDMSGNPHLSTVRTQLRILEEKRYIRHKEEGLKYVYLPAMPQHKVKQSALQQVIDTFFEGSASQVMAALFDISSRKLSERELQNLQQLIDDAKGREKP